MAALRNITSLFCFFSLLAGKNGVVEGASFAAHRHGSNPHLPVAKPSTLFVFGDSYADTGNTRKHHRSSWVYPYGMTFPGKPAGRFSDGRVLTDFLAKFMGVKSPIPYRLRKLASNRTKHGMNFAYGGTGVFDTLSSGPNMSMQIDFFKQLVNAAVYSQRDLHSSLALITVAGNDYGAFASKNGSAQGLPPFIQLVVDQLGKNMRRIHNLGVKRVAVTSLEPLGCLPRSTVLSSFKECNSTENMSVSLHNHFLQQAVTNLNDETEGNTFILLDLYNSFLTALEKKEKLPGPRSVNFEEPLKPCCLGISDQYSCGSVDANGVNKYTVCSNPKSAFFWDSVHPSQQGWHAIYSALKTTLQQLN